MPRVFFWQFLRPQTEVLLWPSRDRPEKVPWIKNFAQPWPGMGKCAKGHGFIAWAHFPNLQFARARARACLAAAARVLGRGPRRSARDLSVTSGGIVTSTPSSAGGSDGRAQRHRLPGLFLPEHPTTFRFFQFPPILVIESSSKSFMFSRSFFNSSNVFLLGSKGSSTISACHFPWSSNSLFLGVFLVPIFFWFFTFWDSIQVSAATV